MPPPNELINKSSQTPANKSGAGELHPSGNYIEKSQLNTLNQKKKSSVKVGSKLKKKIVSKKAIQEIYKPPELNPYLILNISLLYMIAADGEIRSEELSLLQSITGADKSIIQESLKYTQNTKLEVFFVIAPNYLNKHEKLCILLNILDLMLIDGNTAEEELDYFFKLQEVFGFTDEIIKPYLSILKIKNNRKILGPYEPQFTNTRELTPHTIFGVALIFMLSADGIVSENEVGQLQSNVSHFQGLYEASSEYVSFNSVEQFLWDVRSKLDLQQSLFVLINTYDLLSSDGIVDEHEKILFDRFLAAFSFDRKRFASFSNLLEIKNNKLTTKVSDEAVKKLKLEETRANSLIKKSSSESNHLREMNYDEKADITKGSVSQKAESVEHVSASQSDLNQDISTPGISTQSGDSVSLSGKKENIQKGTEGSKTANIQKGKEGSKSENIQLASSSSISNKELQISADDSLMSKQVKLAEGSVSSNDAKVQLEDFKKQNIQSVVDAGINPNSQAVSVINPDASGNVKTDSLNLNEGKHVVPIETSDSSSNNQKLVLSNTDVNLQAVAEIPNTPNLQGILDKESESNHQAVAESTVIDLNRQSLDSLSNFKDGEKSSNNDSLSSTSAKLGLESAKSVNLQGLLSTSLSPNSASLNVENLTKDNLAGIPTGHIVDNLSPTEIDPRTLSPRGKSLNSASLQERFANITAEIDDLNVRLDLMLGLDPRNDDIPINSLSDEIAPLDIDPEVPISPQVEIMKVSIISSDENLAKEREVNLIAVAIDNESTSAVGMAPSPVAPQDKAMIGNDRPGAKEPNSDDQVGANSEAQIPTDHFKDKFNHSKPKQIATNNQPTAEAKLNENSSSIDLGTTREPSEPKSQIPAIDNIIELSRQKFRKDMANESLAVFNAPNQIILETNVPISILDETNFHSQLFEQVKEEGSASEVFTYTNISAPLEADPTRLYGFNRDNKLSISLKNIRRGKFQKSALAFAKVSLTVALFGVWSYEYLAPCTGDSCSAPQTGAPLMIKPDTTSLFHSAVAVISSATKLQS